MTDDQLSQTAEAVPPASDEDELRAFGYEPQLERSMGAWSSFSISISCMCVTAGVFTTYAYSLGMVGPAFVWTWLIVSIGQILVALVLAELAGRMPISGYAYQWTSRLINSHYGWFVGWAGLMAFIPGFTGLNFGLAPVLLNRLGMEITPTSTLVVVIVVLASQLAINLAGVRIASRINNAVAFAVEIGLSIILIAILLVVGFITNPVQSFSFLTTSSVAEGNGFTTAILLSGLLAMWVLTGFEGAADLAEETKMATRHVPKAVIRSLLFAIIVGFLMIVGLTINIDNLADTVGADVPVSHILETALGIWRSRDLRVRRDHRALRGRPCQHGGGKPVDVLAFARQHVARVVDVEEGVAAHEVAQRCATCRRGVQPDPRTGRHLRFIAGHGADRGHGGAGLLRGIRADGHRRARLPHATDLCPPRRVSISAAYAGPVQDRGPAVDGVRRRLPHRA